MKAQPAGPCPAAPEVVQAAPHLFQHGNHADLISYGGFSQPDHGATVALGHCHYCHVAMLAVAPYGSDDTGADGVLFELAGAELGPVA
jgi:hypothetical protein